MRDLINTHPVLRRTSGNKKNAACPDRRQHKAGASWLGDSGLLLYAMVSLA